MINIPEASGILVAIGKDQPGLANQVAAFVRSCSCTIDDTAMQTLRAYFATLLRFCGTTQAVEKVKSDARTWGEKNGFDISLYDDLPDFTSPRDTRDFDMEVYAIERMGIIDDVTRVLYMFDVNIRKLDSRIQSTPPAGELLYHLRAVLQIPILNIDNVEAALDKLDLDCILSERES